MLLPFCWSLHALYGETPGDSVADGLSTQATRTVELEQGEIQGKTCTRRKCMVVVVLGELY